jgi:hypothetical protein
MGQLPKCYPFLDKRIRARQDATPHGALNVLGSDVMRNQGALLYSDSAVI